MDNRVLLILEVSQKQNYIFSSKKLRDNAARSEEIARVTGSGYFKHVAGDLYSEEENMVSTGGGHTVLQFGSAEQAKAFAARVTERVLRDYNGLELFAKQMPYDEGKSPGENLKALTEALEKKKSVRQSGFRLLNFGVEKPDSVTFRPKPLRVAPPPRYEDEEEEKDRVVPPEGWKFPVDFDDVCGDDNFLAVIHIDGNSMGKRVGAIYDRAGQDWESCCASLRRFSDGITADFHGAFQEMLDEIAPLFPERLAGEAWLPVRPVILAGDDVTFVAAGKIGLECARIFLEKLSVKRNCEGGDPYAACAGVALVHRKFPFHRAYALAEELCDSAKKFGAWLDPECRVSAMDWHIEYGELRNTLSDLRKGYHTEDIGNSFMHLRPVAVLWPKDKDCKDPDVRTYAFFRSLCSSIQGESGKVARSKIKELRQAFKQGELESRYFLHDLQIQNLLYHGFTAKHPTEDSLWQHYRELLMGGGKKMELEAFRQFEEDENTKKEEQEEKPAEKKKSKQDPKEKEDPREHGVWRCLFFDAIEIEDEFTALEVKPV